MAASSIPDVTLSTSHPSSSTPSDSFDPAGSLSVLLIEDAHRDARLFEEYLEESATEAALRHEETLQAGLGALEAERPDVLVVDLGLPDSAGIETVKDAAAAAPQVPVVVLTGQDDLQAALQAQEAGAAQYLRKEELTPTLAGRTLRWAVQRHRMQAKLQQRDAWVRSMTDNLSTGIFGSIRADGSATPTRRSPRCSGSKARRSLSGGTWPVSTRIRTGRARC
jgi:DNA-binding response OmpR family regulator